MKNNIELNRRIKEQLNLFEKIKEKAEYSDGNYTEIKKMVVFDEKSICIENANGIYAQIVEALPISIYVKDKNHNFTYVNARGREMLKFHNKLIFGVEDKKVLIDKKAAKNFRREDIKVIKHKKKYSTRESWINEKDEDIVTEATRYPIIDKNNEVIGVVSIADDITWKQKALVGREIIDLLNHDIVTGLLKHLGTTFGKSSNEDIKLNKVIFDFINEYLGNLSIYYETDISPDYFSTSLKTCNIKTEVFDIMYNLFIPYNKLDPYHTLPEFIGSNKCEVKCNIFYLKLMVFQQLRNHNLYGKSKTNLIVVLNDFQVDKYELIFKSAGPKIETTEKSNLGVSYFPSEVFEGVHSGLGLYVCNKIALIHQGNFEFYYDPNGYNCFKYTLKKF